MWPTPRRVCRRQGAPASRSRTPQNQGRTGPQSPKPALQTRMRGVRHACRPAPAGRAGRRHRPGRTGRHAEEADRTPQFRRRSGPRAPKPASRTRIRGVRYAPPAAAGRRRPAAARGDPGLTPQNCGRTGPPELETGHTGSDRRSSAHAGTAAETKTGDVADLGLCDIPRGAGPRKSTSPMVTSGPQYPMPPGIELREPLRCGRAPRDGPDTPCPKFF